MNETFKHTLLDVAFFTFVIILGVLIGLWFGGIIGFISSHAQFIHDIVGGI